MARRESGSKPDLGISVQAESVSWHVDEVGCTIEPKSPVQKRLEKRCRSPAHAKTPKTSAADEARALGQAINLAKKRRDDILEAQAQENGRRVARAKEIARKLSEERQQERQQLAIKIEDKLRAAHDRRQEFLHGVKSRACSKTPSPMARDERSRSLVMQDFDARIAEAQERRAHEVEKRMEHVRRHLERVRDRCDQLRMVRRLQGWWRISAQRRKVSLAFQAARPGDKLRALFRPAQEQGKWENLPFETLAEHLSEGAVIEAARDLLCALKPTTKGGPGRRARTTVSAARSFLASLMICAHPDTVLGPSAAGSNKHDRLRAHLGRTARALCGIAERLMELCVGPPPKSRRGTLAQTNAVVGALLRMRAAHLAYARAFVEWKHVDAICIAEELLEAYVQIQVNLHDVRTKAEADRTSGTHDPGLEQHVTGNAGQVAAIKARVQKLLGGSGYRAWLQRSEAMTRRALREAAGETSAASGAVPPAARKTAAKATATAAPLPQQPGNLVTVPSNEAMVHELALDPEYRLAPPTNEDPDQQRAAALARAALAAALERGDFGAFVAAVDSVRARLGALTPNRPDLVRQLDERLDGALLAQQLGAGAFDGNDLYKLVHFIGERLLALQAPARQAQTEAWLMELHLEASSKQARWQQLAPQALDHILHEMAVIDVDLANFHLGVLATHLKGASGPEYLQAKFEARVRAGEYARGPSGQAPRQAEAWLRSAYETVAAEMPSAPGVPASPPPFAECMVEGLCRALFAPDVQSQAQMEQLLPETLREFDARRLFWRNRQLAALSLLAVVKLMATQVLRVQEQLVLAPDDKHLAQAQEALFALCEFPETAAAARTSAANVAPEQGLTDSVITILDRVVRAHKQDAEGMSEQGRITLETLVKQAEDGALRSTVRRQLESIVRKSLRNPEVSCEQLLKKVGLAPWHSIVAGVLTGACAVHKLHSAVHAGMYKRVFVQLSRATMERAMQG